MIKISFLAILIIVATTQVSPPVWPVFQELFEEQWITAQGTFKTLSILFYDPVGERSRLDRVNGMYDSFCSSVLPNQTSDCSHLVVNSKRYIYFPQKNQCCYCCDSAHGCGILKPNWLESSIYIGQQTINRTAVYHWKIADPSTDYYSTTDAKRIPIKINEGTHVMNFIQTTYKVNIDETVFQLPSYCSADCPSASRCGMFRDNNSLRQQ